MGITDCHMNVHFGYFEGGGYRGDSRRRHRPRQTCYTPAMAPAGYTCLAEVEPLIIEIRMTADGLWIMNLFDRRGAFKVTMPPSEFSLDAAKEKALICARYYMQKYGGDRTWTQPTSVDWREFTPRSVIWET
jgi:hypothetical protein